MSTHNNATQVGEIVEMDDGSLVPVWTDGTPAAGTKLYTQPKGTAAGCPHRFMYFGDQEMRRCADCGEVEATQSPAPAQPAERLLAQVREVCAATLRAGPGVAVALPAELAEEGRKFMRGEASLIEQLPFADVQKLGDVLNETPATAQAPAVGADLTDEQIDNRTAHLYCDGRYVHRWYRINVVRAATESQEVHES